jgi:hypothetical protein
VARLARRVYAQFTAELLAQQMNAAPRRAGSSRAITSNTNPPFRLHSDRQVVELTANNCTVRDEKRLELTDDVVIVEYQLQSNQPGRTLQCQKALLDIEGDELAPTLTLDIRNAKWITDQAVENLLARYVIRGLVMPAAVTDNFKTDDILNEITPQAVSAALHAGPSDCLSKLQNQLQRKIAMTLAEIGAEIHSRLVFGIGCITLIMIGIELGIILKGGHLLTAFAASAVPAMALVTCIMMGKNITKNPDATALYGIGLMWAGLIVLSGAALQLYRWLLRH